MGDDEVRPAGPREVLLEELDRLEVEVVRRLVEQQDVGRREDGAREHRTVLLAARELREGPAEVGRLVEPEAGERLVHLGDHVVPPLVLEAVRQVVITVMERRGVLPFGHVVLEPPHLRLDGVEVREGAGDVVVE